MTCSIRLRVTGGLLDLARVIRFLRRHRASHSSISLMRDGSREFATVLATVRDPRRSRRLAIALPALPSVLEAVISDGDLLLAHYFAHQPQQTTTRETQ
jgi:hypothetical protein